MSVTNLFCRADLNRPLLGDPAFAKQIVVDGGITGTM
jgi:hypothetical protein